LQQWQNSGDGNRNFGTSHDSTVAFNDNEYMDRLWRGTPVEAADKMAGLYQ
jgi:hypothetical protein